MNERIGSVRLVPNNKDNEGGSNEKETNMDFKKTIEFRALFELLLEKYGEETLANIFDKIVKNFDFSEFYEWYYESRIPILKNRLVILKFLNAVKNINFKKFDVEGESEELILQKIKEKII